MDTLQIYNKKIEEKKIILNYIIDKRIILNQIECNEDLITYFKNEHQRLNLELKELEENLMSYISSL